MSTTNLSIELEDLDLSPFSQRGRLGKAHQLFGEQLSGLLDKLNEALAARRYARHVLPACEWQDETSNSRRER